jgi:hypothetical protein
LAAPGYFNSTTIARGEPVIATSLCGSACE